MSTIEKITCRACGTTYEAYYDSYYATYDPPRCPTCTERARRGLTQDWALARGPHLVRRLVSIEIDGATAPDLRRLICDERMALQCALQRRDGQAAVNVIDSIQRLAQSWGLELGRDVR